jgi:hypothetical protein
MNTGTMASLQLKNIDKTQNIIAIASLILIAFSLYHLSLQVKQTKIELEKLEEEKK